MWYDMIYRDFRVKTHIDIERKEVTITILDKIKDRWVEYNTQVYSCQ